MAVDGTAEFLGILARPAVQDNIPVNISDIEPCCEGIPPELTQVEILPYPKKTSRIISDVEGFEWAYLWEIYALLGSIGCFAVFAVIANGLILTVLLRSKALRRMKNLHFIILFAVSILNALIYYSYLLLTYHSNFDVLNAVCYYVYGWLIEVVYNISMTTLLGMCLERLISVVEPLWFSTVWMDENYTIWLSIAMIFHGTLPAVLPIISRYVEYHHNREWMYCRLGGERGPLMVYIWLNISLVYIPAILGVVGVYIAVQVKATKARQSTRKFREECRVDRKKEAEKDDFAKLKKSLYNSRITILLLCLFVGTKLPLAILSYSHLFHMKLPFSVRNCEFVGNLCRFFFSVFTPFLFPLLNTPLKNKVLGVICRGRGASSEEGRSKNSTFYTSSGNTLSGTNKYKSEFSAGLAQSTDI